MFNQENIKSSEKFKGWPSGDSKPLLELDLTVKEIENKYNIKFFKEKDDLDCFDGMYVNDSLIGPITFKKYINSPECGIIINVDFHTDSKDAIKFIKAAMKVKQSNIIWMQSEI